MFKHNEIVGLLEERGFIHDGGLSHWYKRGGEAVYVCASCRQFRHLRDHVVIRKISKSKFKVVPQYILDNFEILD